MEERTTQNERTREAAVQKSDNRRIRDLIANRRAAGPPTDHQLPEGERSPRERAQLFLTWLIEESSTHQSEPIAFLRAESERLADLNLSQKPCELQQLREIDMDLGAYITILIDDRDARSSLIGFITHGQDEPRLYVPQA